MTPSIVSIDPPLGPTGGGNLVRITGDGFASRVQVRFGDAPVAGAIGVAWNGQMIADVAAPAHAPGAVDVAVQNLDDRGVPVDAPAIAPNTYQYEHPSLLADADLTRLVRTVVQVLRRDVLDNAHLAVNVDFDDTPQDPTRTTALARVPSLTVSGPSLSRSTRYGTSHPVDVQRGGETIRHRPARVADLTFTLTGASRSVPELLNLLAAASRFVARTPWIGMRRDPDRPELGSVRWDVDAHGDWITQIPGEGGVHTFTGGFVIRGFAVDDGLPVERLRGVDAVALTSGALRAQGAIR
jgi:hypothetical protein